MGRTWAFCLEPDQTNNNGNFVNNPANPPAHGVFWATGDVSGPATGPFTFANVTFFDADDAPVLYDGDNVFYAIGIGNLPGGLSVQDIVVSLGRLRNKANPNAQATVGSPVKFPSGSPRCILNKDINGLTQVILPGPGNQTTTYAAIGPIKFNKDPGNGKPNTSRFESLVIARIGTAPNNITAEFAFDPEVDVDNGL
jgi:hypothetical protein